VVTQVSAQQNKISARHEANVETLESVQAAETILRRFGARAISILTGSRQMEDGRTLPARLSANDCYVAMEEACRKMARVALRKFQAEPHLKELATALPWRSSSRTRPPI